MHSEHLCHWFYKQLLKGIFKNPPFTRILSIAAHFYSTFPLFFALSPPSFNGVNMFATKKVGQKKKAHNWQVGNEPLTFVPPLIFQTDARRVMFALLSPALIFLTTPLVDSIAEVKASDVTERVSLRVYFARFCRRLRPNPEVQRDLNPNTALNPFGGMEQNSISGSSESFSDPSWPTKRAIVILKETNPIRIDMFHHC